VPRHHDVTAEVLFARVERGDRAALLRGEELRRNRCAELAKLGRQTLQS
jgi:hypothetical protein